MTETLHPCALHGERVALARLRREDVSIITARMQNLELTTLLSGQGLTFSAEDEGAWFEAACRSSPDRLLFGIYALGGTPRQPAAGRLLGTVELRQIRQPHGSAELGIALYDPADWGGGYGSEAARLISAYGVFHFGLHNILLKVFSFNPRAAAAYRKAGFREFGRRSGALLLGGERYDEVYMELLAPEVDTGFLRAPLGL